MHAVVRLGGALEIVPDPASEDLIFDKQLYLGKLFAIPLEVELDNCKKIGKSRGQQVDYSTCFAWFLRKNLQGMVHMYHRL